MALHLFNTRSQMTSKFGENNKVAEEAQLSVSLMFFPHFDLSCNLLLYRPTATWNLFALYNYKKQTNFNGDINNTFVLL